MYTAIYSDACPATFCSALWFIGVQVKVHSPLWVGTLYYSCTVMLSWSSFIEGWYCAQEQVSLETEEYVELTYICHTNPCTYSVSEETEISHRVQHMLN